MTIGLIQNARLLDLGTADELGPHDVVIEDGRFREVGAPGSWKGTADWTLDASGQWIIPGLIDLHVHATATSLHLADSANLPSSWVAMDSVRRLEGMLLRGFTTVRDAGGADWGLAQAVSDGLVRGPRLFVSGRALSQTAGHGDFRGRLADVPPGGECSLHRGLGSIARVADGVEAVRQAARDELRRGAVQLKLMVSGGAASPIDPLETVQYSEDEIRAAVEVAESWNTYVMGHAYTARSIERAVRCGVKSIEHASFVTAEVAEQMREAGAVGVPTLATFEALETYGGRLGFSPDGLEKVGQIRSAGEQCIETLKAAGVTIGFGTDLLGDLTQYQCREFLLRREVQSAVEVVRSATVDAAKVLRMEGQIGEIRAGACADALLLDQNPLASHDVLAESQRHLTAVVKDGALVAVHGEPVR